MGKLSLKQQIFADEYIITGNAYQSAIKAGYSKKYAKAQSHKLLENVGIKSYITKRLAELKKERTLTMEEAIELTSSIARGEPQHFEKVVRDAETNEILEHEVSESYAVIRDTSTKNQLSNETYHLKIERGTSVTLWGPSEVDSVSQSQFTQSIDNINLRIVEKGTVTSQINLESGRVLIDTNQLLLNASTVRFSGSAFIPDAMIQTLTASKINTGTLNAANVNIINLNANNISSGYLSSDRILANSITADKIRATSLDLFNNDSYTNVRADGMRIQGKAQTVFDNWRDSSNTLRTTQGVYIGGMGGGTKHMAFTRSNGSTFMLRAENGMDYGTNQNVSLNQLNIYDNVQFWESARVHGNLISEGYIAMGTGGVQDSSIQFDRNAATMNFYVQGGKSGSYFFFNQKILSADGFASSSLLSLKNVKGKYQGSALDDICSTEIVEYRYKNNPTDRQLSPIIDDINEVKNTIYLM